MSLHQSQHLWPLVANLAYEDPEGPECKLFGAESCLLSAKNLPLPTLDGNMFAISDLSNRIPKVLIWFFLIALS